MTLNKHGFQKQLFIKIDVLKTFAEFAWICNSDKKRPQCKCLPENFSKFLRITFLQNTSYLCNIAIKARGMKQSFCLQINTKVFYKMVVSLWVQLARQVQSVTSNEFTISLQYLKENMNDEVDFLPVEKCSRFFQIDTTILLVCGQVFPNYLK